MVGADVSNVLPFAGPPPKKKGTKLVSLLGLQIYYFFTINGRRVGRFEPGTAGW